MCRKKRYKRRDKSLPMKEWNRKTMVKVADNQKQMIINCNIKSQTFKKQVPKKRKEVTSIDYKLMVVYVIQIKTSAPVKITNTREGNRPDRSQIQKKKRA